MHKYLKKNKPNGLKRGRDECYHIDSDKEETEKLEKSEGEDDDIDEDFAELQIDSDEDSEWDLSLNNIRGISKPTLRNGHFPIMAFNLLYTKSLFLLFLLHSYFTIGIPITLIKFPHVHYYMFHVDYSIN